MCANRILVQEGIHDKFVAAYQKAIESIRVGDGFAEGCNQGPLINQRAVDKVNARDAAMGIRDGCTSERTVGVFVGNMSFSFIWKQAMCQKPTISRRVDVLFGTA